METPTFGRNLRLANQSSRRTRGRLEQFDQDAVGVVEVHPVAAAVWAAGDEDRLADKGDALRAQVPVQAREVIHEQRQVRAAGVARAGAVGGPAGVGVLEE